ncbi:hypothetical protein [Microbacterium sp. SLBN-146]|uniref:hypothetical protein n=1 Tax=Microbacterium sp. SLBN-146 TaxID=2768457 RepID=UPI0011531E4B|nr:hypothetical protein [Microbacterium sp. SLBN-146]TQJ31089.1 hypothetical protein FBY39_1551 [Microbacterium sp. SLBN-146]
MTFRAADRVYVDESKARGYYVVATATAIHDVHTSERALRDLLKPGQRRIHFKSESDSRRRHLLSRMCGLDVRVSVWVVKQRSDKEARPLSLGALTEEAVRVGVSQLIIERDESLERADRRLIANTIRRVGSSEMQYRHVAPHEHPLLWVSGAVAWCYSNGGDWVRRVEAIVESRVTLL